MRASIIIILDGSLLFQHSKHVYCRSVAATVVEMFTGKTPYKARMTVHQILMQVGAGHMNPMQTPAMQESLDEGTVPADMKEFLNACFKL